MGNVVDIESASPHFCLHDPVDNKTHVVPLSMMQDIAGGRLSIYNCDESAIRAFIAYSLESDR